MTTFTVTAGSDHLARVSKASPLAALSELIWNALDADSRHVTVSFLENKLDSVSEVLVADDGQGMAHSDAEGRFGQLGGSWKRKKGVSDSGRFLHGSEGKGRFKALSLGRVATWNVVYSDLVDLKRYSIDLRADAPNKIEVTAPEVAEPGARPGVTVRISDVGKSKAIFTSEEAIDELNETFAPYLADYRDVIVEVDGERLDPEPFIASRTLIPLPPVHTDGKSWNASVDLIEWICHDRRTLFLANERGAPLLKANRKFHVSGARFTAYLRSEYISLLQEQEALDLAEMNEAASRWLNDARRRSSSTSLAKRPRPTTQSFKTGRSRRFIPLRANQRILFKLRSVRSSISSQRTSLGMLRSTPLEQSRAKPFI